MSAVAAGYEHQASLSRLTGFSARLKIETALSIQHSAVSLEFSRDRESTRAKW